jgi:RNA-directed DNA polymerase
MQALFLQALDPVAETTADTCSFGFRRERSCADAIDQCFITLARRNSPQWVLEGDIKACFDEIDHDWLLCHAPMDRQILKKWLKAGYLQNHVYHPTEQGTPQGGIVSPVLANLVRDGMEKLLKENFPTNSRSTPRYMVNLIRYADDFVITGSSQELLATQVQPLVADFLRARGLELSEEKTRITHIDTGFDFLGQNIRKYHGKMLIKPSKANVASFLADTREVIKANKTATAGALVNQLNPKILGWAMYHRHVCAKEIYQKVDNALFHTLWQWAVRRHPDKGKRWIAGKYFTRIPGAGGGNQWVFFGKVEGRDGQARQVVLQQASNIRIRRHIKIRAEVNPYSPDWEEYLEGRHSHQDYRSRPAQGAT